MAMFPTDRTPSCVGQQNNHSELENGAKVEGYGNVSGELQRFIYFNNDYDPGTHIPSPDTITMADLLGGALSAVGLGGVDGDQPTTTTPVEPIAPTTPPQPTLEPSSASKTDETSQSTATENTLTQIATPTSQIAPTTITVTGEATAISASTSTPKQADGSNTGAIAAGVIACFAAAGIIIAIIVWRWRRKHKPEKFQQLDEISTNIHAGTGTRKEAMPYSPDSVYPVEKLELQPVVHEMPDTSVRAEMDGGQRYHAYKPALGRNGG